MKSFILGIGLVMWLAAPLLAQEFETPALPSSHATTQPAAQEAHLAYPHPTLPPPHSSWAGAMVLVILFLFFMALCVGVAWHMNAPDEPPADSHHHDDHGHADASAHDAHHNSH